MQTTIGCKVLDMTNNQSEGYRLGPEARVVLHRHGATGGYAVAVVVAEGPYSKERAAEIADEVREAHGGWVTKGVAASRLGLSVQMVDVLRRRGQLESTKNIAGHVMISAQSLARELERRAS